MAQVLNDISLSVHGEKVAICDPLGVAQLSRLDAKARGLEHLTWFRIAKRVHKYSAQLSGGRQQRAAIARASCMQPHIMAFYEPTSALVPGVISEVLDTMTEPAASAMTMMLRNPRKARCGKERRPGGFHGYGTHCLGAATAADLQQPEDRAPVFFLNRILTH
jgi:ABC-type histidine transport system ATPase subunit